MSSFKAPLVVLQDRTGSCPIQTKRKQRRLPELLSIYWVHIWKADFWNAMHIHCDFLTTSSPAEGKIRSMRQLQPVENARIVSDNACFGFHRAFCLTDFTSCQYEIATCNEEKFDTYPRLGQICANPTKNKIWVLYKNLVFLEKTKSFSLDLQLFGSFKLLVHHNLYNYIQYIIICMYIYI